MYAAHTQTSHIHSGARAYKSQTLGKHVASREIQYFQYTETRDPVRERERERDNLFIMQNLHFEIVQSPGCARASPQHFVIEN